MVISNIQLLEILNLYEFLHCFKTAVQYYRLLKEALGDVNFYIDVRTRIIDIFRSQLRSGLALNEVRTNIGLLLQNILPRRILSVTNNNIFQSPTFENIISEPIDDDGCTPVTQLLDELWETSDRHRTLENNLAYYFFLLEYARNVADIINGREQIFRLFPIYNELKNVIMRNNEDLWNRFRQTLPLLPTDL